MGWLFSPKPRTGLWELRLPPGGPGARRAAGCRGLRGAAGGRSRRRGACPAAARQRAPRWPLRLPLPPGAGGRSCRALAGRREGTGREGREGGRAGGGTATSRRPLARAPAAEAGSRERRAPLLVLLPPPPHHHHPAACGSAALAKMSREPGCNRWLLFAACAHLFFLLPPLRTRGEWPGAGPGRHGAVKGGEPGRSAPPRRW